jgi:hypothetical protein
MRIDVGQMAIARWRGERWLGEVWAVWPYTRVVTLALNEQLSGYAFLTLPEECVEKVSANASGLKRPVYPRILSRMIQLDAGEGRRA